jgi:iron complex outermembrane receptor protein
MAMHNQSTGITRASGCGRLPLAVIPLLILFEATITMAGDAEPTSAPAAGAAGKIHEESPPLPGLRFDEVLITAAPVARTVSELAQPVSVLEGERLLAREAPQLGEVLSEQPGISQTYFGPASSRPIIRGLGADNIRVLENGLGLLDASSLSPDHAVGLEPMLTRRIEVIRGPSALLYGPNAIGGVVNVITTRIPEERLDGVVRGALEGRGNSVNDEGAGVASLEGGYSGFVLHLDGFARKTNNVRIPGFARSKHLRAAEPLPHGEAEERDELINSAIETKGGAGGGSYVWEGGHVGIAPSIFQTTYGIPGAPSTFIDLDQRRLDLSGALNSPLRHINVIKGRLGLVDYQHQEKELTQANGVIVGTEFQNRGYDLRLEGLHERIGSLEGALGFESYYSDFTASGDEAFVPATTTSTQSLFAFEDLDVDAFRLQMAGRIDFTGIESDGGERFGPADSRDFVTGGASVGTIYSPLDPYSIAINLAYTQRSPNAAELYANGPHLATGQFEIGDRDLSLQESLGIEAIVRAATGRITGSAGGFYNHFNNFIDLIPTGEEVDVSDGGHLHDSDPFLPVFQFENVPARFVGFEIEGTVNILDRQPYQIDLSFQTDFVDARNRDTGEPLPYIPPFRIGSGIAAVWQELSGDLSILWARQQDNPGDQILPTDSYVLLNLNLGYRLALQPATVDLFLRGTNLLDQDVRIATSTLKDVAPLPGAGVRGGFRLSF